jgi:hypothetical protein
MMANENKPAASELTPPMRFTLRELFVLTALVCAFGASWSWAAAMYDTGGPLLVLLTFALSVGYALYVLSRSPLITLGVTPLIVIVSCCLLPPIHWQRSERRHACSNNLRNIALALQQYHETFGSFPPAYVADASGRPMHSWRVLLLPFLDQGTLYKSYDFSEPWDGPNNSKLHGEVVKIFYCLSRPATQPRTDTNYVVVVGPRTMWPGTKAANLGDLIDGTTNTLMVVEIANSGIHWMEPRDLDFSQMPMQINPPKGQGISSDHPDVALGAFADGRTRVLTNNTPPKIIRALLTAQGGETIGDY